MAVFRSRSLSLAGPAFRVFAALFLLACAFIITSFAQSVTTIDLSQIKTSPPKRTIRGGEVHRYEFSLSSGQYVFIAVDQIGADVRLALVTPDATGLAGSDGVNGASGLDYLAFVTKSADAIRLEVSVPNKKAAAGEYEIKIVESVAAGPAQLELLKVFALLDETAKLAFRAEPADTEKVIANYRSAAEFMRGAGNPIGEGISLFGLGQALVAVGDRRKALEHLSASLAIWHRLKISSEMANTNTALCAVFIRLGRYQEALTHASSALPIYEAGGDRAGETSVLMMLGNFYATVGESASALDYYEKAVKNWRELGNEHRVASTMNSIGLVHNKAGDREKAFKYYSEALRIYRSDRPGTRGEANVLNQIGFCYVANNDHARAESHFNEAVQIWKRITDAFGEPIALLGLALVYEKKGEVEKAFDILETGLRLARERGVSSVETSLLFASARMEKRRGNLAAAKERIDSAITIVESTRAGILSEQFRSGFFAETHELFDFYIDLLMTMHEKFPAEGFHERALEMAERARARGLAELLVEANADIRSGIDPALLEQETDLQHKINAAEQARHQLILQKRPQPQVQAAEANLRTVLNDFKSLQAEIRRRSPRYSALTQPAGISISEIQTRLLAPDTRLVEYWLGKERSFVWVVSTDGVKSRVLQKSTEIEAAARTFYAGLTSRTSEENIAASASSLSKMLIDPVASEIAAPRLLLVSDGILQYIPFASLPSADGSLLIEDHEIVGLPSASAFSVMRSELAGRRPAQKSVAVIADPVFSRADLRILRPVSDAGSLNAEARKNGILSGKPQLSLPRLPGSRREAMGILALSPPTDSVRFLDFAANKSAVMGPELGRYRYIHFATHGILNSQAPELSSIALSMVDENGHSIDGYLRLHEIYNLKLQSDLVVLSACETGLGRVVSGEGVVGLTRGFMYAGAKGVVVSLWKVDDQSTSELMRRFYGELLKRSDVGPGKALRTAQLSMLKEKRWRSPYYWAAFQLQGEWK